MHDRRPEDFYDPWDENGPIEIDRSPEHSIASQPLLSTLMRGVRGVLRTLPIRWLRPPS
jgi:hypothetical protein